MFDLQMNYKYHLDVNIVELPRIKINLSKLQCNFRNSKINKKNTSSSQIITCNHHFRNLWYMPRDICIHFWRLNISTYVYTQSLNEFMMDYYDLYRCCVWSAYDACAFRKRSFVKQRLTVESAHLHSICTYIRLTKIGVTM